MAFPHKTLARALSAGDRFFQRVVFHSLHSPSTRSFISPAVTARSTYPSLKHAYWLRRSSHWTNLMKQSTQPNRHFGVGETVSTPGRRTHQRPRPSTLRSQRRGFLFLIQEQTAGHAVGRCFHTLLAEIEQQALSHARRMRWGFFARSRSGFGGTSVGKSGVNATGFEK